MEKDYEKRVFEGTDSRPLDDFERDDLLNNQLANEERQRLREQAEAKKDEVPMSNGENCGIVEFEGKRINTCDGEQIVDSGYDSPDR